VIVALFAPWIAPYDVGATDLSMRYLPPSAAPLVSGTDSTGPRHPSRASCSAHASRCKSASSSWLVSAVIGTLLGAIAGYYGGWVDRFVSGTSSTSFSHFPACCCDRDGRISRRRLEQTHPRVVHHRLGRYARLIRGQVLKVREYDFVRQRAHSARATRAFCSVHILPNAIQPLIRAGESRNGGRVF
jgi:peptide/nickel transport system permease protein